MLDLCRRTLLKGIGSATAAGIPAIAFAPQLRERGVEGIVSINGKLVGFAEIDCEDLDVLEVEHAVVIMDGRLQIQSVVYASSSRPWSSNYTELPTSVTDPNAWSWNPDHRRTGLVQVASDRWVRVPVLGRVIQLPLA